MYAKLVTDPLIAWNLQLRIPGRSHGTLLWYSKRQGLLYQLV